MAAPINGSPVHREQDLLGQTVVVIGGSSGIGLETARLARAKGATSSSPPATRSACTAPASSSGPASPPSTPPTSAGSGGSSPSCPRRSTTCWSPAPVPPTRRWPSSTSTRHAATSTPISCCRCRSPGTPRARCAREARCSSWAAPAAAAPAAGLSLIAALTAALPALTQEPRARARARPGQPDRGRLRRHAAVGLAARRPARDAPRAAPHDAADRPRRRPGRHRRAGRPPHDEHRDHRRDLRHRRRPATRRRISVAYRGEGDTQLAASDRGQVSVVGFTDTRWL